MFDSYAAACFQARADVALEELRLIGGEITLEGNELTAAAAAAGLSVRWLDFAGAEAQAAIAAQGRGTIRLPLVIVGGTYTLQRPPFTAVSACLAALRSGDGAVPDGAIALDRNRRPRVRPSIGAGVTTRRRRSRTSLIETRTTSKR